MKDTRAAESYRSLVTVAGLLAGFSSAAVIGLVAITSRTLACKIAFIAFQLATFLFIASAIGGWVTLEWIFEHEEGQGYQQKTFFTMMMVSFLGGLLTFVAGAIATAFFYSGVAGVISTVGAVGLLVFLFVAMRDLNT